MIGARGLLAFRIVKKKRIDPHRPFAHVVECCRQYKGFEMGRGKSIGLVAISKEPLCKSIGLFASSTLSARTVYEFAMVTMSLRAKALDSFLFRESW